MSKLTKKDKAFIAHVKTECKRMGIKCDLRPVTGVKVGEVSELISGYFHSEEKQLVVAMSDPDALGVLVHEYCHVLQWKENTKVWKAGSRSGKPFHEWLEGKKVRNIRKHIAAVRDMELDNERRAVRMIKKWGLSVPLKPYIREANAYIHFYNWMHHTRVWSNPLNSPQASEIILSTMSEKFNMKYHEMPRKVFNAFTAATAK
jgi:hypothetical protein